MRYGWISIYHYTEGYLTLDVFHKECNWAEYPKNLHAVSYSSYETLSRQHPSSCISAWPYGNTAQVPTAMLNLNKPSTRSILKLYRLPI
jgi:hypothetical protein